MLSHSEASIKERLYQQYARIGKCLSSDKRLELLDLLSNGPKSVEILAQQTGMSVANVSRHLQVMLDSRLVKFRKEGTYAIYNLGDPVVSEFLMVLWKLCENRLSDIPRIKEDLLQQYEGMQTIAKEELLERMAANKIVVLDIRPKDEYEAGHIEGAISVPLEELDTYLQTLPSHIELAAYCRGPYCVNTTEAVERILKKGFTAYRIDEGVHAWNLKHV
ncbi:metalloregulator ArsR/SmtB family transcription factor [Paenibacillus taichungensis]|uniref:Metalloregulator ArsR/SmtB family transcription factor n=1 Tax=Paenibacillus taichungensis TaxID=484184 RepID=A0ABX2MT41_9BACL|nr:MULTISPECIES: metalloregulator ArsR/SmtB family transcription factor [Paenibacillus]NUU56927.1 metalloregulator ArsR/SmtB family transcription factor [Paenibacillus taichungensis]PIH60249.1 ArsR family transcriptional regulator [Paenibacillus sp. LK1]